MKLQIMIKNDFNAINSLENQEEGKMNISKSFENVSEFEQRQIFIHFLNQENIFNASSFFQSRILKLSRIKIFNVFEYYKLYNSFKK